MKKGNIFMIICVLLIIVMIVVIIVKKNSKNNENESANIINSKTEDIYNDNQNKNIELFDDEIKTNKNINSNEVKRVDNLEIENIKLSNGNGASIFTASVTNKGTANTKLTQLEIILFDNNHNVLTKLNGLVDALKPGESTKLNIGVTADFKNVYDFEIKKK